MVGTQSWECSGECKLLDSSRLLLRTSAVTYWGNSCHLITVWIVEESIYDVLQKDHLFFSSDFHKLHLLSLDDPCSNYRLHCCWQNVNCLILPFFVLLKAGILYSMNLTLESKCFKCILWNIYVITYVSIPWNICHVSWVTKKNRVFYRRGKCV